MTIELHRVCVGRVAEIAPGRKSAIRKSPVDGHTVQVGPLGIDGDEQQDHRVHGGSQKAVYAYAQEHFPAWEAHLGWEVWPGLFGENLSISGIVEDEVRLGDEWAWGEVRLQVTGPRLPCYKLDTVLGRKVGDFMLAGARNGWYFTVLAGGVAPASGPLEVVARGDGPTIAEVLEPHRS